MTDETDPDAVWLNNLDPQSPDYAIMLVDQLLLSARKRSASDIHLQPTHDGIDVRMRCNGLLQSLGCARRGHDSDPIVRLKVMAGLLTYKTRSPQEGRLQIADLNDHDGGSVEMRVSTFPTIDGERAVVRLFHTNQQLNRIKDLGLSVDATQTLLDLAGARDGAVLVTGPAGSGKTTTLYAMLRQIAGDASNPRSVLTIEDPVETRLPWVSQTQLEESMGMTWDAALRSMLRQDPEVVMVGEIRDPATAEAALGASLTGHLVLSSLHAGDVATALRRLVAMHFPAYLVRSGVRAIVCQRLVRRLCSDCCQSQDPLQTGLDVTQAFAAVGCHTCHNTGYVGRVPISEILLLDQPLMSVVVDEVFSANAIPAQQIQARLIDAGMNSLAQCATDLVQSAITSAAEVHRVIGICKQI